MTYFMGDDIPVDKNDRFALFLPFSDISSLSEVFSRILSLTTNLYYFTVSCCTISSSL